MEISHDDDISEGTNLDPEPTTELQYTYNAPTPFEEDENSSTDSTYFPSVHSDSDDDNISFETTTTDNTTGIKERIDESTDSSVESEERNIENNDIKIESEEPSITCDNTNTNREDNIDKKPVRSSTRSTKGQREFLEVDPST